MESTQNTTAQDREKSIGKRIAALRKAAGMTQEQLAERLGVTPQAVSKWENDVSCPDISMLPQLATVFGVSTDALLGREPMAVPTQVYDTKKTRHDGVWFGVAVALGGAALLCSQFAAVPFPLWPVVWSAMLLGVGVAWMVKHFSILNLGVAVFGLYFLLKSLGVSMPFAMTWPIGIALGLIFFGLNILYERLFPPAWQQEEREYKSEYAKKHAESSFSDADGRVDMRTSFGEDSRKSAQDTLRGGSLQVRFGSGSLDLRGVRHVQSDAVLHAEVRFGNAELWLPRCIRAELRVGSSLGAADEHGAPYADAQTLLVEGSVSFGALEIHYAD